MLSAGISSGAMMSKGGQEPTADVKFRSCSQLQSESLSPLSRTQQVLCLGDCFTECAFNEDGWATLLKRKFPQLEFVNQGCSGRTTQSVLSEVDALFGTQQPERQYLLVVIALGTSDALGSSADLSAQPRVPVEEYERNLALIVEKAQEQAQFVCLISPVPVDSANDPTSLQGRDQRNELMTPYVEAARSIASLQSVLFVDLFAHFCEDPNFENEVFRNNGVGLSKTAHEKVSVVLEHFLDAHEVAREQQLNATVKLNTTGMVHGVTRIGTVKRRKRVWVDRQKRPVLVALAPKGIRSIDSLSQLQFEDIFLQLLKITTEICADEVHDPSEVFFFYNIVEFMRSKDAFHLKGTFHPRIFCGAFKKWMQSDPPHPLAQTVGVQAEFRWPTKIEELTYIARHQKDSYGGALHVIARDLFCGADDRYHVISSNCLSSRGLSCGTQLPLANLVAPSAAATTECVVFLQVEHQSPQPTAATVRATLQSFEAFLKSKVDPGTQNMDARFFSIGICPLRRDKGACRDLNGCFVLDETHAFLVGAKLGTDFFAQVTGSASIHIVPNTGRWSKPMRNYHRSPSEKDTAKAPASAKSSSGYRRLKLLPRSKNTPIGSKAELSSAAAKLFGENGK